MEPVNANQESENKMKKKKKKSLMIEKIKELNLIMLKKLDKAGKIKMMNPFLVVQDPLHLFVSSDGPSTSLRLA